MRHRPLRFGLVGLGRWGRNISRTIARLKNVELGAVCSRNPAASSLVPSDCTIIPDWESLLELKGLDGLLVAVPPAVQADIALASIGRGLPVFLEKPMATDMATAERIYRSAVQAECPVLIDHIYTFHPGFRKLASLARVNGPIISFYSKGGNLGPVRPGLSPLWDWAPHDVSMCLSLMEGQPINIVAFASETVETPNGISSNYTVRMAFQNNAIAELFFGNAMNERIRQASIHTSAGDFAFTDTEPWITLLDQDGARHHLPYRRERALSVAIRSFAHKVRSGNSDNRQLRESVEVIATIARIESALASSSGV